MWGIGVRFAGFEFAGVFVEIEDLGRFEKIVGGCLRGCKGFFGVGW